MGRSPSRRLNRGRSWHAYHHGLISNTLCHQQRKLDRTTDKTWEANLKLGARYYNPTTARFTQPDPSGQEPNTYNYASCNPTNRTDPTGRFSFFQAILGCAEGIGAALSTGIAEASLVLGPEAPPLVLTTVCLVGGTVQGFALE